MPGLDDAELPNYFNPLAVINNVKNSQMNTSEKRPGVAHIKKVKRIKHFLPDYLFSNLYRTSSQVEP